MLNLNPDFFKDQLSKQNKPTSKNENHLGGANFQNSFRQAMEQKTIESMNSMNPGHNKKRKKDGKEVMSDYEEGISDLYDILEMQSHIRKIFRKIDIKQKKGGDHGLSETS